MEMDKSQDRLLFAAHAEPRLHKPRNTKPVSLKSAEQTRTDALLEELAEIIESEGGVLIPKGASGDRFHAQAERSIRLI
jgi:hypothetical protein